MQKHFYFALVAVILALIFAIAGCRKDPPAPATLILGFGTRSTYAKSFMPEEITISSIKIEGQGPGGEKVSAASTDSAPIELSLSPGSWLIAATGFNAKGLAVASGFLELTLGPSECQTKDIFLAPLAGEGSVSLSWTLSGSLDGVLSIEGSLTSSSGAVVPIAAPFGSKAGGGPLRFEALGNGGWKLELRLLKDGTALCGLADGVIVAAGMETKLSVLFKPPEAALSLSLVLPDYAATSFSVEPSLRRVSRGISLLFRAPVSEGISWYAEGVPLPCSGPELRYAPSPPPSGPFSLRIDCVAGRASLPRSGSAQASIRETQGLGGLAWGELIDKDSGSAASQARLRGLGDCRDLAWSADGAYLATAGKGANALSLLEAPAPGAVFPISCLGGPAGSRFCEPRLLSPSILRFLPNGSLLALSESEGAAYSISCGGEGLSLTGSLCTACLAGAKDLAVSPDGSCAYAAASGADAIALLSLSPGGTLVGASAAAAKGAGTLASFSRPGCLALSPDGATLAVGTAGDDAIYFFDRDGSTKGLAFRSRLDKAAFPALAPLSDPCFLAFSRDGASLFVLSYYGRAIVRLDRDPGTGLLSPVASAKSGLSGVMGFAYPKRLALSSDNRLLAIVGSGAEDGLALFDVGATGRLDYKGSLLPEAGCALPPRPSALAFSPDGRVLAVAADGYLSFFMVNTQ